ncbi:hypothetical protein GOB57_08660 [Sinorhizobium meliloti]|nr:hypothetical protein [Sinorhizobium meliloti]
MQLDIKFPMLVRATPAASRKGERYFYGSHVHRTEVAEISTRETETGLGSLGFVSGGGRRRVFPQLRSYGNRLYRPLGNPEGLFANAFKDNRWDRDVDYVVAVPALENMARRPLAYPIQRWTQWFIDLHGMDTARNYKIWPEERSPRPAVNRNDVDFSQSQLLDVNGDDFTLFERMFEAQADRLLMIGGKFWMETTMPYLSVTMEGGDYRPKSVRLDVGFLPLAEPRATWMRFPLAAYDEALAFAEQIAREWRASEIDIGYAEVDGLDLSAVGFDHNEEVAHAMTLAVGSNLVRRSVQHEFHKIHENADPLFEGARLSRFLAVKEAILSNNDITGQRSDLISLMPEVLELWNSVKKPRYEGLGLPVPALSDRLIAKAVEMSEDTMINVPTFMAPRP